MGVGQGLKTTGNEDPVFSPQGHYIRHGAKAYHIGIVVQHLFLAAAEGGCQLEGHAYA